MSPANLAKYCACHAEMPHILSHLSPHHIWNVTSQCAEQQVSRSNLTKYCACHEEMSHICLILVTYETSFPMRGATECHYPTSPNTAPATKQWHCTDLRENPPKTGETSFPMRGRSEHDPSMIRPWSDHDPTMNTDSPATRLTSECYFSSSPRAFSIEKYNVSRNRSYYSNLHQNTAPATKSATCKISPNTAPATKQVTLSLHQVLRLPRKVTTSTSPSTAPDHEKWHLNFTKYCACHEKWHLNFTKYCACHEKWLLVTSPTYCACHEKWHLKHSPSTVPATKSDTWTSPNTAPVTQKVSHT